MEYITKKHFTMWKDHSISLLGTNEWIMAQANKMCYNVDIQTLYLLSKQSLAIKHIEFLNMYF